MPLLWIVSSCLELENREWLTDGIVEGILLGTKHSLRKAYDVTGRSENVTGIKVTGREVCFESERGIQHGFDLILALKHIH